MKKEPIDLTKLEVIKELIQKAFSLVNIAYSGEHKSYVKLAQIIVDQIGVKVSAKSIVDLDKNAQSSNLFENGFRTNKAKEVLAAFVLLKEGFIDKHQIKGKSDSSGALKPIAHNHYFEKYYNNIALFKQNFLRNIYNQSDQDILFENKIPDHLVNTNWRLYNFDAEGVIYGHILNIQSEVRHNLTRCEIINADKGFEDYNGWVGIDNTNSFLIFRLLNKNTRQKYVQMMCKLVLGSNPEVIIGIITYISSSRNVLTSSVTILERLIPDDPHDTIIESIDTPISAVVRNFFESYKMQLLRLPTVTPVYLDELAKWFGKAYIPGKGVISDEILASYCQEYWVYYMYEDDFNQRVIDKIEFEIYFSLISGQIKGNLKVTEKEEYTEGIITRNDNFISCYFSKSLLSGASTRTNYLVFKIGGEFIEGRTECFLGTITGLAEDYESAVSYLALITPKSFQGVKEDLLIDFFSKREWKIEPATPRGFKFNNLDDIFM